MKIKQSWLDSIAISASFACLVHCLALPLLIAALPSIAEILNIPESFHMAMVVIAVPTSMLALGNGYRKHGTIFPIAIGVMGLCFMTVGAFWSVSKPFETALTVMGSVMLALAHVGNWLLADRKHFRYR